MTWQSSPTHKLFPIHLLPQVIVALGGNDGSTMETGAIMAVEKPTKKSAPPPYTSKIIKASALLDDTKTLLSHGTQTLRCPTTWIAFDAD
jgi:hypothetical protein